MKNIYLIGMMGSGKSVTARELAAKLGRHYADLDKMIEEKTGRPIAETFEKNGEEFFRGLESEILEQVASLGGQVVATGGGCILRPENVAVMKRTGKVVYLETSLEYLWQRVRGKKGRPLLKGPDPREALNEIFKKRRTLYESAADLRVDTDGKTAAQAAADIEKKLGELA